MHVRKVTIVLVVLLLSLVAGAAMAQTNLPPITLNGGESITVQCASGRNLAVERSPDRKAAVR